MVSMKTLATSERARILHLLCEGTSIRAITRLTGASKNTIAKLLGDVGRVCMAYHDEHVRNLKSKRIQVDEAPESADRIPRRRLPPPQPNILNIKEFAMK